MISFIVALMVLVAIGVLVWKAVNLQPERRPGAHDAEPPTGPTRSPTPPWGSRPGAVAPDDDPEFLRRLDDQLRRREREDGEVDPDREPVVEADLLERHAERHEHRPRRDQRAAMRRRAQQFEEARAHQIPGFGTGFSPE